MNIALIILMIIVGVILLLLEVFVLPGFIAGIIGFALIGVGVWQAFVLSTGTGFLVLVCTLVASILIIFIAMKSKTWNKVALHDEIDGKTNVIDIDKIQIGDKGIAVSRLAPMGKAFINEQYYEVSTLGEFVDHQQQIEVIRIDGNKIIVKQIN
ncbi:hypothetical protein LJC25_03925 [Bacteroidales bacterium OttesenSCG-928-K03]|nr:hypothetical protein [Bacteroidales bacterium OttesenSCG-928-L14]MDL2242857.1 hypothetical protein [Bacteroidales bacterium OttesenSCG-928-K03]